MRDEASVTEPDSFLSRSQTRACRQFLHSLSKHCQFDTNPSSCSQADFNPNLQNVASGIHTQTLKHTGVEGETGVL